MIPDTKLPCQDGAAASTIRIELHPVGDRPGVYAAMLDGRCLVRSRRPFLDAARVLIGQGEPATAILEANHAASATVALRGTLGEAARWTVEDSDTRGLHRRSWRPHPMASQAEAEAPENAVPDPAFHVVHPDDLRAFLAAPASLPGGVPAEPRAV